MPNDTFQTLRGKTEGFYKEKGSKFIALAYYAETEDDIREISDAVRKEYYDARHHCYAYVLGKDGQIFRANDDGEPHNSAGMPILNQIRSFDLRNVFIVVVRYFGGTKLGVSGLINAYKTAAADALNNAEIYAKVLTDELHFRYDYTVTNEVMRVLGDFDPEIKARDFDHECRIKLAIRQDLTERLQAALQDIEGLEFLNP